MEVDEQSHAQVAQAKVSEQLRLVSRRKGILGFHVHDDMSVYDQVEAEFGRQADSFIPGRNPLLPFERDTTQAEFMAKCLFVDALEQSRA